MSQVEITLRWTVEEGKVACEVVGQQWELSMEYDRTNPHAVDRMRDFEAKVMRKMRAMIPPRFPITTTAEECVIARMRGEAFEFRPNGKPFV